MDKLEFNINEDGDIVIDRESITVLLEQLEKLPGKNSELFSGWEKKEYCCVVRRNGEFVDQHQYKEYPILAEAVCVRHTLKDCGTDPGCSGHMSKGECEPRPNDIHD